MIRDKGVNTIGEALPHSVLTSLDLDANKIGDEGAKAFLTTMPESKLTSLDLHNILTCRSIQLLEDQVGLMRRVNF